MDTEQISLCGEGSIHNDGSYGFSFGRNVYAGYAASAFGGENQAIGDFSSVENYGNKIYAEKAHGEGSENIIGKTAIGAHVEGHKNYIHYDAKGEINFTSGSNKGYNHVEGYNNKDYGWYSHIEN
jgi:hypothetical protein